MHINGLRFLACFGAITYSRQLKKQDIQLSIGFGYSLESDYLSIPLELGVRYTGKDKVRSYSFLSASFSGTRFGKKK